ncbi:hypothetical protein BuS5_03201 [Desulfosarcina sp. BuS5]|uniref:hypothetical protein n=1 Tax=Desulfosarcina sp. BuS5 TaxID=933262 RepID=UPI000484C998|nr:hypothetical protein [Desulfosarcina sp. BuS5]WDN90230.1 hypothetical protein BuS5_03201 [Desulfosarcina sp. BuS5]
MKYNLFAVVIAMAIALGTAGCTTMSHDYPATSLGQVSPVMTEYSLGLACLGELIDQTNKPPLRAKINPNRWDKTQGL